MSTLSTKNRIRSQKKLKNQIFMLLNTNNDSIHRQLFSIGIISGRSAQEMPSDGLAHLSKLFQGLDVIADLHCVKRGEFSLFVLLQSLQNPPPAGLVVVVLN